MQSQGKSYASGGIIPVVLPVQSPASTQIPSTVHCHVWKVAMPTVLQVPKYVPHIQCNAKYGWVHCFF